MFALRPTIPSVVTLPGVSIRPHKFKALSHKTTPVLDASCKSGATCPHRGFPPPPPLVQEFARKARRTQENTLLTFTGLLQRPQLRNSQAEDAQGEVRGWWCRVSITSPGMPHPHPPGSSPDLVKSFYSSISNPPPLPPQRSVGGAEGSHPLPARAFCNQLHPEAI